MKLCPAISAGNAGNFYQSGQEIAENPRKTPRIACGTCDAKPNQVWK
jgi:hypothetical protein